MEVRPLTDADVASVVDRVGVRLFNDARRQPLVNPTFDRSVFARALRDATNQTWVALEGRSVVGHLFGAVLESDDRGPGAWIGPDGASFDDVDVLAELYAVVGSSWIDRGARDHFVWVFDDALDTSAWYELGFARAHARGVMVLEERPRVELPSPYRLRRGGSDDIELAVALDAQLDEAQRAGPSFAFAGQPSHRQDLLDALEDREVQHYVVEYDGVGVAQCLSFGLDDRRGSFSGTTHVSALSVRPEHQHRGIGRALIDAALGDAKTNGGSYAETNWRVTNRRAALFWRGYGFQPTYVRLRRTIEGT